MAEADSVTAVMDRAEQWASVISDKLAAIAAEHGPATVELALMAARIDAAKGLVTGALGAFLLAAGALLSFRNAAPWMQAINQSTWGDSREERDAAEGRMWHHGPRALIGLPMGILGILLAADNIFDIWRWAGVIEPKLWLAKKVLGL